MQITVSTGTWTGSGITYTYQWRRAGTDIPGATSNNYIMDTADTIDSLPAIDCVVTGTNAKGTSSATAVSVVCKPVITMSVNKIAGSLAFAGSLTRKASPSAVLVYWGDDTNTSVTTSLSKTYATAGIKDIRVYSELDNIVSFNVTTISTRLVSFTAIEPLTSITSISISNQSTSGIFTTLAIKNLPVLTNLVLTSAGLTSITSSNIDNLPLLNNLMVNSMSALTTLSLPILPSIATINAGNSISLNSVSLNNNFSITGLNFSKCNLTSLDLSGLINLNTLTLGNASTGNNITSLDISDNEQLINVNLKNISMDTFIFGNLPLLETLDISNNLLSGSLVISSSGLLNMDCSSNAFTSLTYSSDVLQSLICNSNQLTNIIVTGKSDLIYIDITVNEISGDNISDMLNDLVSNGANDGQFYADNQTPAAPLNSEGELSKTELESRGWFISVDT